MVDKEMLGCCAGPSALGWTLGGFRTMVDSEEIFGVCDTAPALSWSSGDKAMSAPRVVSDEFVTFSFLRRGILSAGVGACVTRLCLEPPLVRSARC